MTQGFAQRGNSRPLFHNCSEGIPHLSVSSIAQDPLGFIWVGTRYGLQRYDGLDYISGFPETDSVPINSANIITAIEFEPDSNIWVGTNGGGLRYFNYSENRYEPLPVKNPKKLDARVIHDIHVDSDGHIWVGTQDSGLWLIDRQNGTIRQFLPDPQNSGSISSNNVSAIQSTADGEIWIGTWDRGLNLWRSSDSSFQHFTAEENPGLEDNNIRTFLLTEDARLLAGTGYGPVIIRSDAKDHRFEPLAGGRDSSGIKLQSSRVLSLAEGQEHIIWAGSENEGLFSINLKSGKVRNFQHNPNNSQSLCSNSIWSLLFDKQGILWIGTFNQGLCKIDPQEQKFPSPIISKEKDDWLRSNVVSSFSESRDHKFWIGTEGGGLHLYNPEVNDFKVYQNEPGEPESLSSNYIVCLEKDPRDNLWIGTWEGGLNLKKPGDEEFVRYTHDPQDPNSPANNDIYTMLTDSKGRLWMSCFRAGVDIYLPRQDTFHHLSATAPEKYQIESNLIRAILEDDQGNIWLGSEGRGVFRLRLNDQLEIVESVTINRQNSALESDYITFIFQDNMGTFWIGTEGGGLYYGAQPDKALQNLNRRNGLGGNIVYSIEQSHDSLLWISTNQGLSRFNYRSREIRNYSPNQDGSPGFYRSSSLKASDGHLLFGGINGFFYFHPSRIPYNPVPPEVYITDFHVQENPDSSNTGLWKHPGNVALRQSLALKSWQNDFQLKFAALNYSEPEKNHYSYRLTPLDDYWRYTHDPKNIYYNNVPPGSYTLEVKAANNDGVWSKEPATLKISIAHPWYQTYWALGLYTLGGIGLLWLGRSNVIRNERLRNELKLEHIQLEQANELNRIRAKFFTYISHEFRTPLTLIMAPLKDLREKSENSKNKAKLEMILQNARRLLLLINQILDLSKIESGHLKLETSRQDLGQFLKQLSLAFTMYADDKMIRFEVNLPKDPVYLYFDFDKLEKVMVNLLSNAFKFTSAYGKIELTLHSNEDGAVISVSDTGKGIPADELDKIFNSYYQSVEGDRPKGSGIGLTLSKELVELHRGKIKVSSAENEGSRFDVYLPFGKDHLKEHEITEYKNDWEFKRPEPYLNPPMDLNIQETKTSEQVGDDRPLILLAEDNIDLLNYLKELFREDYRVITATDGKEAVKRARNEIPDIIISDIIMPKMDGHELCSNIKADATTSHIPVILLTAKASSSSQAQGFENGAIFYITKPFDPQMLQMRVKNILDNFTLFKNRILENKGIKLEPDGMEMPDADTEFLEKAIKIIHDNISNPQFQVSDLSEQLNMSKAQLYRKMKGLLGCSTNEFIRITRLKKAAILLRQGNMSVSETTYQVGFNDLQYFRKCFVSQYGVTPSEYAASNK